MCIFRCNHTKELTIVFTSISYIKENLGWLMSCRLVKRKIKEENVDMQRDCKERNAYMWWWEISMKVENLIFDMTKRYVCWENLFIDIYISLYQIIYYQLYQVSLYWNSYLILDTIIRLSRENKKRHTKIKILVFSLLDLTVPKKT
jgi:hypothetical protein